MRSILLFGVLLCLISCKEEKVEEKSYTSNQYITVLGTAQDGGYPHIGCQKECCFSFYEGKSPKQRVVSLGLLDKKAQKKYIFEATPDITTQLDELERENFKTNQII